MSGRAQVYYGSGVSKGGDICQSDTVLEWDPATELYCTVSINAGKGRKDQKQANYSKY